MHSQQTERSMLFAGEYFDHYYSRQRIDNSEILIYKNKFMGFFAFRVLVGSVAIGAYMCCYVILVETTLPA